MSGPRCCILAALAALAACDRDEPAAAPRGDEPGGVPAPAQLRRLTDAEYRNTLLDLFGEGLVLPVAVEPDSDVDGLVAVGAAQTATSPLGVERYEDAAYLVAEQVAEDPARRARFSGCGADGPTDDACAEAILAPMARLAWRRTPTDAELVTLVSLSRAAGQALDGFEAGLSYGIAAVLQSPSFLYRVELGQDGRFSPHELASRMAYLLWAGPPDDALLALAEDGSLAEAEVRRAEAERMLDDPRARRGLRAYADDWFDLNEVPGLPKDPALFVHWGEGTGAAAREQTLATLEWLVFDAEGDIRDLMTTRTTVLDRSLAALYGVPAPSPDGFALTELPVGPRVGLLGQASFLAHQAHTVSTSVTLRGLFVHTTLLCREIPPPPANVDTSIPEPSEDAPTMRDRVAVHLESPACATCHEITDPVGLAFEQFDGIGRFRTTENGATIDPSGSLDDARFGDAAGLARTLRTHPDLTACLAETALRYAQGHALSLDEAALAGWHEEGLREAGFRYRALLVDIVAAEGFAVAEVSGS